MTTTHATSYSERFEAARLALAAHDDPSIAVTGADGFPLIGSVERAEWVIAQMRALAEPPATDEGPDQIAAGVLDRYDSGKLSPETVSDMLVLAVNAGIQAAWESWEPDSSFGADLPKPEPLAVHSDGLEVTGHATGGDPWVDVSAWGKDTAEHADADAMIHLSTHEARALAADLVANADAAEAAADA